MQVPNDFCCLSINKNIFMKDFTEYEYRIYSYSDCGPNTNFEYRIYSFLANSPNTNTEYICNQKIEYWYSMPNIQIFEYICITRNGNHLQCRLLMPIADNNNKIVHTKIQKII